MKTRKYTITAAQTECNEALIAALDPFKDKLSAMEMLAIAAHLCGRLIALQDQSQMTSKDAMTLVMDNIVAGNAEAIRIVEETVGSA